MTLALKVYKPKNTEQTISTLINPNLPLRASLQHVKLMKYIEDARKFFGLTFQISQEVQESKKAFQISQEVVDWIR